MPKAELLTRAIGVALAVLLLPLAEARAWGPEGHSIIAELAQRRLSPAARIKVREILGSEASLASLSTWADDIRESFDKSFNWHFVSIPLSETDYDPARDCQDTARGDCIIKAIERNVATLRDSAASGRDRLEALKYLIHFIGDLHQPLHTVKDFVGGNRFEVTFFTDPSKKRTEPTNLHALWDVGLIRATVWAWGTYVTRLEEQWLPAKDIDQLSQGNPIEWARDAHRIAVEVAFTVPEHAALGEDYLRAARPFVDQQLALAGLRLARILNDALR